MKNRKVRYLTREEVTERLNRETLERWKEYEEGKVVSNEAVMDWLATWGTENEKERPPCGS